MIPTAIICAVLFTGSLYLSWRLAQFLKAMDRRDAERAAIAEAERIASDEFDRVWGL